MDARAHSSYSFAIFSVWASIESPIDGVDRRIRGSRANAAARYCTTTGQHLLSTLASLEVVCQMLHRYPVEVRRRVIELARSSTKVAQTGWSLRTVDKMLL